MLRIQDVYPSNNNKKRRKNFVGGNWIGNYLVFFQVENNISVSRQRIEVFLKIVFWIRTPEKTYPGSWSRSRGQKAPDPGSWIPDPGSGSVTLHLASLKKKFIASYLPYCSALMFNFVISSMPSWILPRPSFRDWAKNTWNNVGTSLNFQLSVLYQRTVCYVVSVRPFDLHYPCSLTFAQSVQTVKGDHAAFLSRHFNSKRNSNAPHYPVVVKMRKPPRWKFQM